MDDLTDMARLVATTSITGPEPKSGMLLIGPITRHLLDRHDNTGLEIAMNHDPELMRQIVHGKSRPVHGLNRPPQVIDRDRIEKIADRIASLPEYNSVELIYDLVKADLITFDEMYLLLGKAIRQPERLAIRYDFYANTNLIGA